MNILKRIRRKILLWWHFYQIADNFFYIWFCRALTIVRLHHLLKYDAIIVLRNGIRIAHGALLDVSAVPVTVEIWKDKKYSPAGFSIKPGDTVLDIGGNVGNFALYAATFTTAPIYCIEPMPENIERIKRNIALNNFQQIVPLQAAAADQEGQELELHISSANATHSLFSPIGDTGRTIMVKTINVEALCEREGITKIGFMKVDCEGAEYDIILHWSAQFTDRINQLVLEYHTVPGHNPQEIIDFLSRRGFAQINQYDGQYISARR